MKNRLLQILAITLIVTGCKTETKNEGQSSDITYGKDGIVQNGTVDTRMGKLTFENGYPSRKSVENLFDEMDFQRACQAYIWALPIVSMAEWQGVH